MLLSVGSSKAQSECKTGFRPFEHEYLVGDPMCIPENPQRVVALDTASVELLLFTNKEVIATADWLMDEFTVILPELSGKLHGVTDVGYPANLETVVSLKPDLILGYEDTMDVAAASQIAPVVVPSLEKETAFTEGFKNNPIFMSLEASKNDKAFFVGGHWWRSQTYLLANKVLDDLFAHLANTSATTQVLEPRKN
jgi:ABC-type Fe3+-hydroxamate transport system substrate-binding protein